MSSEISPPESVTSASSDAVGTSGLRILVIDDDEFLSQEIKIRLEDLGHQVVTALSGEKGITLVDTFHPQLVLVDWIMKGLDGLEVCRALRRSRLGQLLYIMLLTQHDNEDLLVEAFDAGADDYISKPIAPRVLVARIRAGERLIRLQAQVERERREAHRYLDIVEVMILGLDMEGNITLVNRKGCEVLGYSEYEILGKNWFDTIIPEEYCEPVQAVFEYSMQGNMDGLGYFEIQLLNRNNDRRLVAWHNNVITEQGEITGFLFAGEDITEQRSTELERKKLAKHLQQAQKMQAVGNLTGGIAHNFNNILATIIGYTELAQELASDTGEENLKLFLQSVYDAGIEARGLVTSLTSFSRGSEGEARVPLLPPVLSDIERMLKPVLTSSIQLKVTATDQIPNVMIDPDQVNQMVMNLCINARDAMGDSGTIDIILQHHSHLSGVCNSCHKPFAGEFVGLTVSDNGSGIPATVMSSMFDPFFSTKEVGKGSGLGLSMLHGTIHGYHGHVLVDSHLGEGTRFHLLFPVKP